MVEILSQYFQSVVWLRWLPQSILNVVSLLICMIPITIFIPLYTLVASSLEKRIFTLVHSRPGCLYDRKSELRQVIADAIKLFFKENAVDETNYRKFVNVIPLFIFLLLFSIFAVIPFSETIYAVKLNVGLLLIIAALQVSMILILLSKLAFDNAESIYKMLNFVVQFSICSVPMVISLLIVAMFTGSIEMHDIVHSQSGYYLGFIPRWLLFHSPFSFFGFFIYFITATVLVRKFDFGSQKLVNGISSGFHAEYAGIRFALLSVSRHLAIFLIWVVPAIVYLGGWLSPFEGLYFMEGPIWGIFWIIVKTLAMFVASTFLRFKLPDESRFQMLETYMKVLIPASFICLIGSGIWVVLV